MKGVGRKRRVGVMCREMRDAGRGSIGREFTQHGKGTGLEVVKSSPE